MVRSRTAFALDQGEYGHLLRRRTIRLVLGLAANIAFVRLDNFVLSTEWTRTTEIVRSFAASVKQEPRCFVIGADHAMQLMRAHALFAGGHQLSGENPFRQWDFRTLHDGRDSHREGFAAILALVHAGARALASQLRDSVAGHAAARAMRAIRPKHALQMLARGIVVVVDRVAEINFCRSHVGCPSTLW